MTPEEDIEESAQGNCRQSASNVVQSRSRRTSLYDIHDKSISLFRPPANTRWQEVFAGPGRLVESFGCCSPARFLCYRIMMLLLWLLATVLSFMDWAQWAEDCWWSWFVLSTHWSAMLELVYFFFAALATSGSLCETFSSYKVGCIAWCLGCALPAISVSINVMFWPWAFIFEPHRAENVMTLMMHGTNVLMVAVDLVVRRPPLFVPHLYAPFLCALLWVVFTVIYFLAGGTGGDCTSTYVYEHVYDWNRPVTTVLCISLALGLILPAVHVSLCLLRRCFIHCFARLSVPRQVEQVTDKPKATIARSQTS